MHNLTYNYQIVFEKLKLSGSYFFTLVKQSGSEKRLLNTN